MSRVGFWNRGMTFGLLAAVLFGASTPAANQLLGDVRPQLLAGLLYGGAALLLAVTQPVHGRRGEAPLRRTDLPVLEPPQRTFVGRATAVVDTYRAGPVTP